MIRHAVLLVSAVVAVAVWAYGVNYKTMTALDRVADLRHEIAAEREALQVLRIEWAYLNRPDRLSRLITEHREALGHVPLTPEVLQRVAILPYPAGDAGQLVADAAIGTGADGRVADGNGANGAGANGTLADETLADRSRVNGSGVNGTVADEQPARLRPAQPMPRVRPTSGRLP